MPSKKLSSSTSAKPSKRTFDSLPELNNSELQILNILWENTSGFSIREVHDEIAEVNGWAYSTTKTTMDRMVKKDLLERFDKDGTFLYRALISRPFGLAKLVKRFLNEVLGMELNAVLPLFGQSKNLTKKEIDELEEILKSTKK